MNATTITYVQSTVAKPDTYEGKAQVSITIHRIDPRNEDGYVINGYYASHEDKPTKFANRLRRAFLMQAAHLRRLL